MHKKPLIWRLAHRTARVFGPLAVIIFLWPIGVFADSVETCSYTNPIGVVNGANGFNIMESALFSIASTAPQTRHINSVYNSGLLQAFQWGSSTCTTVDSGGGGGGGGTTTVDVVTDTLNQDLFNGFVVFAFMMTFIIWFFRKH